MALELQFAILIFLAYGAFFGSFFNVLIYRLPAGESIVSPGSHCPKCNHEITWYENIPILSYIFLRAKCSGCGTHISIQYPLIEGLTAIFSLVLYFGLVRPELALLQDAQWYEYLPVGLKYLSALLFIPIALIDIRHFIIPDSLTISGTIISIALAFLPGGITPQQAGIGILAGAGSLFVVGAIGTKILKKDAMGMGDIKMLAWFGALFGPEVVVITIFFGSLFGIIGSYSLIFRGKLQKLEHIPFGPYLCLGTTVAIIWGDVIITWYYKLILS